MIEEDRHKTAQITEVSAGEPSRLERSRSAPVSLLVYHREGAHIVPLHAGESVVVGRMPPSDVTIPDVSLSRQHARFSLLDGNVVVEDLGSTNATMFGGNIVERATLGPGDDVMLGAVSVTVYEARSDRSPSSRDLAGHERFRSALEAEVVRARFFARPLAVVAVRSEGGDQGHVRHWMTRVQSVLRPVDWVGLYSDNAIHLMLPEMGVDSAATVARMLTSLSSGSALICGVAAFPDSGTSAEELLGESRALAQRASSDQRVCVAEPEESRREARRTPGQPVSRAAAMQDLLATALRVAKGSIPVLIHGETGTGKEVLSRYIHDSSLRRAKPLVCVNCAAIPSQLVESTLFGHERGAFTGASAQQKGVFESADGGSVFLDEIGELPAEAQAALLRVLETKRFTRIGSTREISVDVRVIAATHRHLETMVQEGKFRSDLFFRLNTITLRIPPLRDRIDDIPTLAEVFLEQARESNAGGPRAIEPEAMDLLRAYAWPGNIRELKNAIERGVVIARGDTLGIDDLPERVRSVSMLPPRPASLPREVQSPLHEALATLEGDFRTRMERLEVEVLSQALHEHGWNQTQAARTLQMPLRTLVYKIRMHGIRKPTSPRR